MSEPVTGTELTCREIVEFLMAYLEGELPPRELEIFEVHLKICAPCVGYLESYRATIALGRQVHATPTNAPPPPLPEDLLKAILAARKKESMRDEG